MTQLTALSFSKICQSTSVCLTCLSHRRPALFGHSCLLTPGNLCVRSLESACSRVCCLLSWSRVLDVITKSIHMVLRTMYQAGRYLIYSRIYIYIQQYVNTEYYEYTYYFRIIPGTRTVVCMYIRFSVCRILYRYTSTIGRAKTAAMSTVRKIKRCRRHFF